MLVRRLTSAISITLVVIACEQPKHPNNPGIPDEVCQPRCQRDHECSPSLETASCINRCKSVLGERVVYRRADYVEKMRTCAFQQACVPDTDRAIGACWSDLEARYEPPDMARRYCLRKEKKDGSCAAGTEGMPHCLYGHKKYSDAILSQMIDCLEDHPCRSYGACLLAVVGPDTLNDDPDRHKQFEAHAVPTARSRVRLAGKVTTMDTTTPVPNAKICVHEHPEIACVDSDDAGSYALDLPARTELALVITAEKHGGRVVPIVTPSSDWSDFGLPLSRMATLEAKYAAAGAHYPDATAGFVHATARAPKGSQVGLEGVTMTLAPAAPRPAIFLDPTGAIDTSRTATSTHSSAHFANVPPGIIELTMGPEAIMCTPSYGGWPSPKANTVRIPIVAGMETRVVLGCHK